MEELIKIWFSNQLEHLNGLEISGKLKLSKDIVSTAILAPVKPVEIPASQSDNLLKPTDYDKILKYLEINQFNLSFDENSVSIEINISK